MKYWIVPRSDDPNSLAIVGASGFDPVGAIVEAPKDPVTGEIEDVEWLVIQDDVDDSGRPIKKAVVDKAAKKAKIKEKKDKIKADKDKEQADVAENQSLRQYFKNFDKSDLANLSDIQDAIDSIIQFIKLTKKL